MLGLYMGLDVTQRDPLHGATERVQVVDILGKRKDGSCQLLWLRARGVRGFVEQGLLIWGSTNSRSYIRVLLASPCSCITGAVDFTMAMVSGDRDGVMVDFQVERTIGPAARASALI